MVAVKFGKLSSIGQVRPRYGMRGGQVTRIEPYDKEVARRHRRGVDRWKRQWQEMQRG